MGVKIASARSAIIANNSKKVRQKKPPVEVIMVEKMK